MSVWLCTKEECTGCGVCKAVCIQDALILKTDDLGCTYVEIDKEKCIECQACTKVCPSKSVKDDFHSIQKVYAAWSSREATRIKAASGGVATELYRYALRNGWVAYGVTLDMETYMARFIKVETENALERTRNSKYVFSSDTLPYKEIELEWKAGHIVLFIGLPCQVMAVKKYAARKGIKEGVLITCDLICHGVAPLGYFQQHIKYVSKGKEVLSASFRDPRRKTKNHYFSLYGSDGCIYSKKATEDDVYQLGYHKALIYRENCYQCRYASLERAGDLTLGDFSGLGKISDYTGEKENVNCILINTDVGDEMLANLCESGSIYMEERPLAEAVEYERQLREPSSKHPCRDDFVTAYLQNPDFEAAAKKALKKEIRRYRLDKYSGKLVIKALARRLLSNEMRKRIKEVFRK